MPLTTSQAPGGASPLWIIALFIALSEVTAGVASITTDGATRLLFAIFAVVFPVGVFVTFIWLLTSGHAPKLYSPTQYTEAITPEIYADGVNRRTRAEIQVYDRAVAEVFAYAAERQAVPAAQQEPLIGRFEQSVRARSIEVDIAQVAPGRDPFLFKVGDETTVSDLLDDVYFAMAPHVEPYEYLKSWALVTEDGELILREHGASRVGMRSDLRGLEEAGIAAGSRLRAVRYP